jgi:protein tyrosine/serine phosphatase
MGRILDRLYHFHWVTPDLARSAQPWLGFTETFLKPHRLKSVINLRGENRDFRWWRKEKAAAAALGIVHFDVKLSSRNIPARSGLAALFDAFDAARPPVLMKCSGGQDRTALAIALYLLRQQGAAARGLAEAQFALWPYLHRPKSYQRWLKVFPAYALEKAGSEDLAAWARTRYDPKDFAAWLEAHGLAESYRAFQAEFE